MWFCWKANTISSRPCSFSAGKNNKSDSVPWAFPCFHSLEHLKSFHFCFSQYWSPALQLFIICGSEPRAPKKSLTNASTIDWYWMAAQLTLGLQTGSLWTKKTQSSVIKLDFFPGFLVLKPYRKNSPYVLKPMDNHIKVFTVTQFTQSTREQVKLI